MPAYPDAVEPRRPRRPERQGPPQRRPEYDYFTDGDYFDYFPDVDYLDYFDSGWNDFFDDVDYFHPEPEDPRSDV